MREIKFRFYSNVTKEMYNKVTIMGLQYKHDDDPCIYSAPLIRDEANGDDRVQKYSDGHLMQYTGLKDVKGREIYEGDILDILGAGRYKVVFSEGCFGAVDDTGFTPFRDSIWGFGGVVIGNICNHPQLLRGDDDV
jgi:hypothetical protein